MTELYYMNITYIPSLFRYFRYILSLVHGILCIGVGCFFVMIRYLTHQQQSINQNKTHALPEHTAYNTLHTGM